MWQTGQFLYDRRYSQGCMDIWRDQIDSEDNHGETMEQPLLLKTLQQQYHDKPNNHLPKSLCHVIELPDQPRHVGMAKTEIVSRNPEQIPTILHFPHIRVNQNGDQAQRNKFLHALNLRFQTVQLNHNVTTNVAVNRENGSKHFVSRNNTLIPWDTIIFPRSTHGFMKPK
jgi:hypothetical protein